MLFRNSVCAQCTPVDSLSRTSTEKPNLIRRLVSSYMDSGILDFVPHRLNSDTASLRTPQKDRSHSKWQPFKGWVSYSMARKVRPRGYWLGQEFKCSVLLKKYLGRVEKNTMGAFSLPSEPNHYPYYNNNRRYKQNTWCGNKETGLLSLLISGHVDDEEEGRALTRGLPSTFTQSFIHVHRLVWP